MSNLFKCPFCHHQLDMDLIHDTVGTCINPKCPSMSEDERPKKKKKSRKNGKKKDNDNLY